MSLYASDAVLPTRVEADGVKPCEVDRCTSYAVTPTSSVELPQPRVTVEPLTVAVGLPGAVGAVVSAALVKVSVSSGRAEVVLAWREPTISVSVPLLCIAIESVRPDSVASGAVANVVVYVVLRVGIGGEVPSTVPVSGGIVAQVRPPSVQVSVVIRKLCVAEEPAPEFEVVRRRSVAPVRVVPAGKAGSAKRRKATAPGEVRVVSDDDEP